MAKPLPQNILERLERLSTPEPNTGCWLWVGTVSNAGYGQLGRRQDRTGAHRAALITRIGPIPPGCVAMHECNQKLCVNPSHIRLGTQSENLRAAARDGLMPHLRRFHKGTDNPSAKLKPADVLFIRETCTGSNYRAMAARFGISTSTIMKIKSRKAWKHLP